MDEFFRVEEISKMLKISHMTIYRYISAGKIKAYKFSKEFRINKLDFLSFLKQNEVKPTSERGSHGQPGR